MWHWDQGHLPYFQFDAIRAMAKFAVHQDFIAADRPELFASIGLSFKAPPTHSPWRQYSRMLKLCLLVSKQNGRAGSRRLSLISCRKVVQSRVTNTCISWSVPSASHPRHYRVGTGTVIFVFRFCLPSNTFSLKLAVSGQPLASLHEIIGAYRETGFLGDEEDSQFIAAVGNTSSYEHSGSTAPGELLRQARESLIFLSQISYLHVRDGHILVSLDPADAHDIFKESGPILRSPGGRQRIRNPPTLLFF